MIRADMHIHTYFSDGTASPAEVVAAAVGAGLGLVCVTDHDTMDGCGRVKELASVAGVRAVSGLEISAYADVKVHVLGYGLDTSCAAYKNYYKNAVEGSFARCYDVLAKLKARGFNISIDKVLAERREVSTPVHSMFICRAAAKLGYASSAGAFYMSYLVEGKCAHSRLGRLTPGQAVKVIADCGGISSLAHPGRINMQREAKEQLIKTLKSNGLNGIEAVYSGHTESETVYYKEIARSLGLYVTGGSDTHSLHGGGRSVGVPEFYPDSALLDALKNY